MSIESNYSITRLFVSKEITVLIDEKDCFTMVLKPIRALFENNHWNIFYHVVTSTAEELQKMIPAQDQPITSLQTVKMIIFYLGMYDKFRDLYDILLKGFKELLPQFDIDMASKELKVNDIIINEDIWNYIIYILKLSYGEKVEKPLTFTSEEARAFYLAQKAYDDQIKKIRETKHGDPDNLMKIMLTIIYAFPSLTIDYLFDQTMAQIQWLQKYAAGSVSYEVNAKAFAAGNMKKGSKLDFFIK